MSALEEADARAMAELLYEDVRVTMPMPAPCGTGTRDPLWLGRDTFVAALGQVLDPASAGYLGRWRTLPTRANRQPAVAHYVRRPGDIEYRAQVLEVLWVADGRSPRSPPSRLGCSPHSACRQLSTLEHPRSVPAHR
jgi:RNA polymerase sigma-70 factor (ECF subfamily)